MKNLTVGSYNKHSLKYSRHDYSGSILHHEHLEKPCMKKMLKPIVRGKRVLCLGVGAGQEMEMIYKLGAKKVVGIDVSKELIRLARKKYPKYDLRVMNMTDLKFDSKKFDIVYSSLTFHYLKSWRKLLSGIYRVLSDNGYLLFSTIHPVYWGGTITKKGDAKRVLLGYTSYRKSSRVEFVGSYLDTHPINYNLMNEIPVKFYSRPISAMSDSLKSARFGIVDFREPKAQPSSRKIEENFYRVFTKFPAYAVILAQKM